jgi:hypothetical protein
MDICSVSLSVVTFPFRAVVMFWIIIEIVYNGNRKIHRRLRK